MNTGQTMLVMGAFSLLSIVTLGINRTILSSSTLGIQMEANLNALSLGQGLLDEIMSRDFDQNVTGGNRVFSYSAMTSTGGLGPDGSGEIIFGNDSSYTGTFQSRSKFNDVDDYNNYSRKFYDTRLGWFTMRAAVTYIDEINPNTVSTSQTWQKKIIVTITNFSMPQDLNGNALTYTLSDIAVYRKYF
jgi:hypothetical protein